MLEIVALSMVVGAFTSILLPNQSGTFPIVVLAINTIHIMSCRTCRAEVKGLYRRAVVAYHKALTKLGE